MFAKSLQVRQYHSALAGAGRAGPGGPGRPPRPAQENCEGCGKEANFMCSACKSAHYCSTACQRELWSLHSRVCGKIHPGH